MAKTGPWSISSVADFRVKAPQQSDAIRPHNHCLWGRTLLENTQ